MPTAKIGNRSALITHPLYAQFQPTWLAALDVYEGTGGFLDPNRPYLVPHPREWLDHSIKEAGTDKMVPNPDPRRPTPKLLMRRRLARYENIASTILDSVTGSLFAQEPMRGFGDGKTENEQVRQFWKNADGRGATLDAFMQETWITAGVFSHAIILAEKSETEGATAADAKVPRLCRYTPLDLVDWLEDDYGELTAVKLIEPAPRDSFDTRLNSSDYRVRVVDQKTWTLYDRGGKTIETGDHGFGRLPVVLLYGKRRTLTPIVGKSVMGDPQLFIDVYNLTSEVRELLRDQTFARLNVPIGFEGDPTREQEIIGKQSGTSTILFSSQPAQYISPQADNVKVYHEHIDRLGRMIYRLASVPWEGDSRDAESAESRKIKRQEMVSVLLKYRNELQRTDDTVLELVYRALYGESWEKRQEQDEVSTAYPKAFDPPNLEDVVAQCKDALGLDLGATAVHELKKRTVRVVLPNLSADKQEQSDSEIEAQEVLTADEKQEKRMEEAVGRLTQRPNIKPVPKEPAA